MGMPCEVNSIIKLQREDFPPLKIGAHLTTLKSGYRILPMDVPLQLVDENWLAHADVVIEQLTWQDQETELTFHVVRVYEKPFSVK
jgi:hypothetical protein